MATPEAGLSTSSEAIGTVVFGVGAGLFWLYRFFSGRKEPPPTPSMSFEQAFSTPSDGLHAEAERCAEALEEIRDLIKTLISEQEKAKEAEKAAAIQHRLDAAETDRRALMEMIDGLKKDIARQERRAEREG